jgi:quaternary ammonium compound-resistance protein SugE
MPLFEACAPPQILVRCRKWRTVAHGIAREIVRNFFGSMIISDKLTQRSKKMQTPTIGPGAMDFSGEKELWLPSERLQRKKGGETMAWLLLFIAGLFEISWAIGLKYSEGMTRLLPTVFTLIGMVFSFVFLSRALKTIPVGTGYAVWTGIGAAGTAILGMMLFSESTAWPRLMSLALILAGMVGLRLTSP